MKKVSILSVALFAVIFGISSITNITLGQSNSKVEKIIQNTNSDFLQLFNAGDINSLVNLYRDDACLVARGCGKEFIRNYYGAEATKYVITSYSIHYTKLYDYSYVSLNNFRETTC